MKYDQSHIVFETTGLKIYANRGIVGIDPYLNLSEGYDGSFSKGYNDECWEETLFTKEEREELADYMIDRWKRFKQGE